MSLYALGYKRIAELEEEPEPSAKERLETLVNYPKGAPANRVSWEYIEGVLRDIIKDMD